jgi:hypothetical protein
MCVARSMAGLEGTMQLSKAFLGEHLLHVIPGCRVILSVQQLGFHWEGAKQA